MSKLFLKVCILVCSANVLQAQPAVAPSELELRVKPKRSLVCFGRTMEFNLRLANLGRSELLIDPERMGSLLAFVFLGSGKETGDDDFSLVEEGIPTHYVPRFVTLGANESVKKHVSFVLEPSIFKVPGLYRVKIGYKQDLDEGSSEIQPWKGLIYSHPLEIRVKNCDD